MKKSILFVCAFSFLTNIAFSQFEYGLRLGISTQDVNKDQLLLSSTTFQDLKLSLNDASYGYHIGLYTQFKALGLTISPEVLFNSNSYEYKIEEVNESGTIEKIVKDNYQYVDIPVLVGLKLGPLRAYVGPEVHYFVNSFSKLADENGFNEQIQKLNYGAIAGAGLNVGKLRMDIRYEINFADFEDHIFYENNQVNFDNDDSRLVFSLGWKFN